MQDVRLRPVEPERSLVFNDYQDRPARHRACTYKFDLAIRKYRPPSYVGTILASERRGTLRLSLWWVAQMDQGPSSCYTGLNRQLCHGYVS
jgi:hypothetical protein